jgi:hypothetical protein
VVITATGVWRGAKTMGLKKIVDDALKLTEKGGHKARSSLHASAHHMLSSRPTGIHSNNQLIGTVVATHRSSRAWCSRRLLCRLTAQPGWLAGEDCAAELQHM